MAEAGTNRLEIFLKQQESLREVIESISSELELRPLLTRIVRHACELLDAENGTIGLVDAERNAVRTEAVYRMPPDELGAEMRAGVGLAGHVLQTGQPCIFNHYGEVANPTQTGLLDYAVVGLPIFWQGRMTGFFGLGSPPPRQFTPQDVEILALFAKHAAIAIENARRYELERRRTERLALIAQVGRIVTEATELEEILQKAADAIHDLLGYPNVAIPLIDPEEPETLLLRVSGGHYRALLQGEYRLPISGGIMGAAARERRVQLVNAVEADPRYIPTPGSVGIRAELAVPIMLGERILGVLNVESGDRFDAEDAASLQIIADQLAVAIENARLFAGTQRALAEMLLLYQTSRRMSTAMDIEEVIAAYLEQVAARGRYVCSVVLYEINAAGKKVEVVIRGRWNHKDGMSLREDRFPYTEDALDLLLDEGQTVTISDVHTDPRVSEVLRDIQRRSNRPALAMVPLTVRGQRIGLVVLSHPQTHNWQETELRPYQATAAQLATAIDSRAQNFLLYERGQQLAVLEERQRLARELHDSVTQLLFSMTLIAQSIGPAWRRDSEEGERRVQRLLELSQSALAEMRALLLELRPPETLSANDTGGAVGIPTIRQYGLREALRRHVATVARDGLQITLNAEGYTPQPREQEEALYRIAQEALHNVVKHARARSVRLRLTVTRQHIRLSIKDDGIGFVSRRPRPSATPQPLQSGGLGMTSMRERAEALGGSLRIRSAPGSGTTVEATLPMKG